MFKYIYRNVAVLSVRCSTVDAYLHHRFEIRPCAVSQVMQSEPLEHPERRRLPTNHQQHTRNVMESLRVGLEWY